MEGMGILLITYSVMIQAHSGIGLNRVVMAPTSLIQTKSLAAQVVTLQNTIVPVRTAKGVPRTLHDTKNTA